MIGLSFRPALLFIISANHTTEQPKLSHKPRHMMQLSWQSDVVPIPGRTQEYTMQVPKAALALALQQTIHAKYQ